MIVKPVGTPRAGRKRVLPNAIRHCNTRAVFRESAETACLTLYAGRGRKISAYAESGLPESVRALLRQFSAR